MSMKGKRKFKIRHLLFLLFLIYVASTLAMQQFKITKLAQQEAQLKARMKEVTEQREELEEEISLLHTDEYIEGVARDELGLVKPGEYIYKGVESPKE
ncbi:Septum formation initiator [Tepidanaerobacter acetatoxydans Re1]|uniref:Septum formation initiator n=2 Tax=Tepidanaerobacter acetatoxydans TaxID=499229 RepID=F4LSS4_TEPAE|nr:Septum formation initiator [Tepidanaerobacter acetatoxydans Re1]CDI40319.1 Septum formation initiator [Tepidanaerobacter acetatoxydans Re1]